MPHPTAPEFMDKLDDDVNELKSEAKITGFKIYRLEKTMDDMKAVLEKLTDVHHNQLVLQKDIVSIYRDIANLRSDADLTKAEARVQSETTSTYITTSKTTTRILVIAASIVYGMGAWVISQVTDYGKQLSARTDTLERELLTAGNERAGIKEMLRDIKDQVLIIQDDGGFRLKADDKYKK